MQPSANDIRLFAAGLVSLADAAGAAGQVERELPAVLDLLAHDDKVRSFLGAPDVKGEGKRRALEQLFAGRAHPVLVNFLMLLVDVGRIRDLREIGAAFFAQASQLRRKATGEVLSARPLSRETIAAIEVEAARVLGKDVHLHPRVDPALTGGLRVQVEDYVIDGTLDSRLDAVRRGLLASVATVSPTPPG
jgi:F-type H+-transporting ATPase subunit delta